MTSLVTPRSLRMACRCCLIFFWESHLYKKQCLWHPAIHFRYVFGNFLELDSYTVFFFQALSCPKNLCFSGWKLRNKYIGTNRRCKRFASRNQRPKPPLCFSGFTSEAPWNSWGLLVALALLSGGANSQKQWGKTKKSRKNVGFSSSWTCNLRP